eukprot:7076439-Alexandrium_andersonii.AAC.1
MSGSAWGSGAWRGESACPRGGASGSPCKWISTTSTSMATLPPAFTSTTTRWAAVSWGIQGPAPANQA